MKMFSQAFEKESPDSDGFEQRLMQDIPRLRQYIRRQVGNPDDAEDVLQDTLIKSLQTPARQTIRNPLAYGFQVARSVITDHWRSRSRQPEVVEELPEQASVAMDDDQISRQKLEKVTAVLAEMPELRRQVFVLRRLEGYSREQIAAQLNLNEESVKKHITRAMIDIARAIERQDF